MDKIVYFCTLISLTTYYINIVQLNKKYYD